MTDYAIAGIAAIAAFFLLRGGGEGEGGGSGGLGEEIESVTENVGEGLTINVPDYSEFLTGIMDVETKKAAEVYDSSKDHSFDIGTPSTFDPKGRPLYDTLIPRTTKTPLGFGGSWAATPSNIISATTKKTRSSSGGTA
ncbi:MAG: hypothetical protein ACT6FG_05735, partial [Methanosarcinaceae archaeon]